MGMWDETETEVCHGSTCSYLYRRESWWPEWRDEDWRTFPPLPQMGSWNTDLPLHCEEGELHPPPRQ